MNYAVMPLADYDAVCDKVREKANLSGFEDTDFGYVRSFVFSVKESGTYTLNITVKDESKLDAYGFYFSNPDWDGMSSPGMFEIVSGKQTASLGTADTRIFISTRNGLKASDIISATLERNGQVVIDFFAPLIKSGELADTVDKVYEAGIESGKQTEHDRFWDAYQQNGNLTNYENGFGGRGWTAETFKPKYNMQPTTAYMMFRSFGGSVDLVEHLKTLGITLDFSNCTNFQYFFQWSNITRIGEVDIRQAKASTTAMFAYALSLHTIDLLKVAETNTTMNIFDSCSALQNIAIEGVIAASIGFQGSSKLSDASVDSIIAALQDRNGTSTLTFAVHRDVYARMVASGKDALVTAKNWTLVSA